MRWAGSPASTRFWSCAASSSSRWRNRRRAVASNSAYGTEVAQQKTRAWSAVVRRGAQFGVGVRYAVVRGDGVLLEVATAGLLARYAAGQDGRVPGADSSAIVRRLNPGMAAATTATATNATTSTNWAAVRSRYWTRKPAARGASGCRELERKPDAPAARPSTSPGTRSIWALDSAAPTIGPSRRTVASTATSAAPPPRVAASTRLPARTSATVTSNGRIATRRDTAGAMSDPSRPAATATLIPAPTRTPPAVPRMRTNSNMDTAKLVTIAYAVLARRNGCRHSTDQPWPTSGSSRRMVGRFSALSVVRRNHTQTSETRKVTASTMSGAAWSIANSHPASNGPARSTAYPRAWLMPIASGICSAGTIMRTACVSAAPNAIHRNMDAPTMTSSTVAGAVDVI